ncbi:MAG: proton-dependent oligopeptide transporter, family [Acidobacteriota bacterium]|nr:proton-dependent oligopeptide transporter, family [Acidobacteriota bacterium]
MNMQSKESRKGFFKKFPGQFWLVVMFEFFERGAFYGMMSFLSQYFVDSLHFPKENVGIIKGVIQPLLYFLPILAGAIADRFGYRKILMAAFALLGGGYFLTSQMTSYTAVFAALVIMGFGAGTFKPIISGTIAKITDESNSTQAFGVYYWSINMGAFLFPLILVPILKSINPQYVIIASAVFTAAMIIPTAFFFKEPAKQKEVEARANKREQTGLLQTLANAFEIIYSPIVLLYNLMKKSAAWKIIISLVLVLLLGYSVYSYLDRSPASAKFPTIGIEKENTTLLFSVQRNMLKKAPYELKSTSPVTLTIYKPQHINNDVMAKLLRELAEYPGLAAVTENEINDYIKQSSGKIEISCELAPTASTDISIESLPGNRYKVFLKSLDNYISYKESLLKKLHETPTLRGITINDCDTLYQGLKGRSFFPFFVVSLVLLGLLIVAVSSGRGRKIEDKLAQGVTTMGFRLTTMLVPVVIIAAWFIPGVDTLGKIIVSVIYLSAMSLFIIDKSDSRKFVDHGKFLLMIVLYSGFWVLYFQMYDSVLWYVQAYVDAGPLNHAVNGFLGIFGVKSNWFFDVEHVTAIAAGTIILLQLFVSNIVKDKKAMPTMITGIGFATVGMAIFAISAHIWVFIAGVVIFSIGEMTAHPKFISYFGLTAPADKKALYMGYIFLYGVFGSSVGSVLGARLYVHFVDNLNQPRTLWLVFSMIGVITIISLLVYNKFLAPRKGKNS